LPEYLRDTVDWFMGKTRGRKDRDTSGDETKLYLQEPCLERKIPETELLSLTEIPDGLDVKEWIALHTIGFFEHINLIYGTISEFCTSSSCPDMVGPGPRQYTWVDEKGKKSRVNAPQYVDYVMTFVQKTVNDETLFPTKHGNEFPPNFDVVIKKIHRLIFQVLAHIYHSHFREVVLLGLHAHLNSLFAHVIEFNLCYQTIEEKETEVLQDLIHAMKLMPCVNNNCSEDEEEEDLDNLGAGGPGQLDNAEDGRTPSPEPGDNNPETVSGDGDGSINHVLAEQNSHAPEKNSPAGEESSPKQDISLEGTSPQNSEDCSV